MQRGNTSQAVAERLVAEGKAARCGSTTTARSSTAIADLVAGGCDAVLKLAPVLAELVKAVPGVEVVQRGLSVEHIAIAVTPADQQLLARLQVARPSWRRTAHCSGSGANGSATRTSTRVSGML